MSKKPKSSKRIAETYTYPEKNKKKIISQEDLWILSYYRSSELAGSLLMGKMARLAKDDELCTRLTWHFAEEARHAWRWTKLVRELGANPLPILDTYQSNYFSEVGIPKNDMELIAITQIFELRVASHLLWHSKRKNLHPKIKKILSIMIHDEGPHLAWGRKKLDDWKKQGKSNQIDKILMRYRRLDEKVYKKEAKKFIQLGWSVPKI